MSTANGNGTSPAPVLDEEAALVPREALIEALALLDLCADLFTTFCAFADFDDFLAESKAGLALAGIATPEEWRQAWARAQELKAEALSRPWFERLAKRADVHRRYAAMLRAEDAA